MLAYVKSLETYLTQKYHISELVATIIMDLLFHIICDFRRLSLWAQYSRCGIVWCCMPPRMEPLHFAISIY